MSLTFGFQTVRLQWWPFGESNSADLV